MAELPGTRSIEMMDGPSRRHFLASAGGAAVLAAIGPTRLARAQAKETLTVALQNFPTNLRPWEYTNTAADTVKIQLFRGLLGYDEKSQLRPELADSWERVSDTVYVFRLRKNAKFHNGLPVTADDVKFTFDSIAAPNSTAAARVNFQILQSVEAIDSTTVKFTLKKPYVNLPELLASPNAPIISRASVDKNPREPLGAGPFTLQGSERGRFVDLAAFPDFYKPGLPKVKNLRFIGVTDDNLRVAALSSGEADLIEYVPPQNMESLGRDPNYKLDVAAGPAMYLSFNLSRPPFSDVRVRQAIAYAVKRDDLVKAVFAGQATPLGGMPIPPGSPFYNAQTDQYWTYDPARARDLLKQAGLANGFTTTILTTSWIVVLSIAEIVQQNLAEIGITVKIDAPDFGKRFQAGAQGQYEFSVSANSISSNDPEVLRYYLSGKLPPSFTRSFGYDNPEIERLLDQGIAESDEAKRRAIYQQLDKIALDDAGIVGLVWRKQAYAMKKSVGGFANLPAGLSFLSGYMLENTYSG